MGAEVMHAQQRTSQQNNEGVSAADAPRLTRDLTQPEPVPAAGIARALELMQSGRLRRARATHQVVRG